MSAIKSPAGAAVAFQVGPPEEPGLRPRYRFLVEMLSCEEGSASLAQILDTWSQHELPAEQWWEGVHQAVWAEGKRCRQSHPELGYTQLDILVRESTAHRLAPWAESFLEDRGLGCSSVK